MVVLTHPSAGGTTRAAAEAAVRVELLLLAPLGVALCAVAAARGGLWSVLVVPAGLALAVHARLAARLGLRAWSGAAGTTTLLLAGLVFAGLVLGPFLRTYRTVTVLSGSMRPTFAAGDMIIVTPQPAETLRTGDVITYQVPVANRQVETHRIVRIVRPGSEPIVVTKGDANKTADPWQAQLHGGTAWRYRLRVPFVGYAIVALRSPLLHQFLVLFLPALLVLYGIGRLWLPSFSPSAARVPTHH